MRLAALLLLATTSVAAFAASATAPASATDPRLDGAYTFQEGGWTYVHLAGTPGQIGFQHGSLLTKQIEDNLHVFQVENQNQLHKNWAFFREAGRTVLWPNIEPEYQAELKGIAAGLKANGSKLDLWDVVAMNGQLELTDYYLPWLDAKEHKPAPAAAKAPASAARLLLPDRRPKTARS